MNVYQNHAFLSYLSFRAFYFTSPLIIDKTKYPIIKIMKIFQILLIKAS